MPYTQNIHTRYPRKKIGNLKKVFKKKGSTLRQNQISWTMTMTMMHGFVGSFFLFFVCVVVVKPNNFSEVGSFTEREKIAFTLLHEWNFGDSSSIHIESGGEQSRNGQIYIVITTMRINCSSI